MNKSLTEYIKTCDLKTLNELKKLIEEIIKIKNNGNKKISNNQ